VLGRRPATTADEVDEAVLGELAQDRAGDVGRLVVLAEGVGQSRVPATRASSSSQPRICRAPSAQLSPTASGRAWATEYQKASTVWPDSVRPEASTTVPLMMTGRRMSRLSNSDSMP
jgi:hypothetical protein